MVTDSSSGHFPEVFETYLSMLTEKKTTLSVKVGGSLIQIEVGHLYHCYENKLGIFHILKISILFVVQFPFLIVILFLELQCKILELLPFFATLPEPHLKKLK